MTEQEKAHELIKKFISPTLDDFSDENFERTKQCALICVGEIIKEYTTLPHFGELYEENIEYWQKVKEIIKAK